MAARGRFLALSRATGKRVIEKRRRLRLEPLEDRRLLSVATDPLPLAAIDPSTTVVAGSQEPLADVVADLSIAGSNVTTVASDLTSETSNGTYPIIASGAESSDNGVASVAGVLTSEPPAPQATTTSLVGWVDPSVYGQWVAFTATVTADDGAPTGTVNFMDGSSVLGTATVDGSGRATLTTSLLAAGSHTITAVYAGATGFNGSVSEGVTQTVTPAPLTITAINTTRTYGATTPALGANCTGFVNGEWWANLSSPLTISTTATVASPIGSYPITVSGATSPNYSITFVDGTLTIHAAATKTNVTSTPYSPVRGQTVTFTVNVTANTIAPTGTVTFKQGETVLRTLTLDANGRATYNTASLDVGSNYLVAVYTPADSNFASSQTSVYMYVADDVQTTPRSTSFMFDRWDSVTYGEYGVCSAYLWYPLENVSPQPRPMGTVDIYVDGVLTSSVTLSYYIPADYHFSVGGYFHVGEGGVRLVYSGDGGFAPCSASLGVFVAPAPLTITPVRATMVAGSSLPTFKALYSGFVNGETAANLTSLPTLSTTATLSSPPGTYPIIASGAASSDYNITYVAGTLTIVAAPIATTTSLTASAATSVYGDSVTYTATVGVTDNRAGAPTGSVTFYSGSTVLGVGELDANGQATFTTSRVNAGVQTITASYSGEGAFSGSISNALTQTVTRAPLSIAGGSRTKVYGAALTLQPIYSGFVNGDTAASLSTLPTLSTTATAGSPVGIYPVDFSGASSDNYAISYVSGTLSITPAALSVLADSKSIYCGQAIPTLTATYSGFVNGDTVADLVSPAILSTTATPASPYGTYAILASGVSIPNYTVTYTDGSLTLNRSSTTTTLAVPSIPSYYGEAITLTATITSPYGVPTGTVSFYDRTQNRSLGSPVLDASGRASLTTSSLGAGGHSIEVKYSGNQMFLNPYESFETYNHLVMPAPLTVAVDSKSKVYGAAMPYLGLSYSGFVNGETEGSLTTLPTITTSANAASSVGDYQITAGGAINSNYQFIYVPGTLSVTPAPLTITADDQSVVHGQSLPVLTTRYSGFVNGDTPASLTTIPVATTTATDGSNIGVYPISVSGAAGPNYEISYVSGTLAITADTPSTTTLVTAAGDSVYGQSVTFTATVTGIAGGTPTGTVSFFDGAAELGVAVLDENGQAAFNTSLLAAGAHSIVARYSGDETFAASTSDSIAQNVAPASLTVTADSKSKVYGDWTPTLTVSYAGFVNADTVACLSWPAVPATTATRASGVGSYPITVSSGTNPNYAITYVNGALSITPASLVIKSNDTNSTYGSTPSPWVSYIGFVNGDDQYDLTKRPTVTTLATSSSPVGTYLSTASGAISANYAITYISAVHTIVPATITVTPASKTMLYGQAVPALTVSYSGFKNGDTVAKLTTLPTVSTTATPASHPGCYWITASGAAATNYVFSYATGKLLVTPAPLTITVDNKTIQRGQTVPPLTASYSGFVNGDTASSLVNLPTISTTGTSASPVGTYLITASGATSSNYMISYVAGTLTIEGLTAATTTSIVASASPSVYGQSVTFTATVTADGSTPTGTVSFMDGSTVLSTATLDGSGQATYTTSLLVAGSHTITAVYAGDTGFDGSTSDGLTQTVTPAPLTITADSKTKTYGAALPTLTASYSGFVLGETAANLTVLPTLSTTATAASPAGTYPITASGASSSNYTISYVAGTQTVTPAALTITADNKTKLYGAALPTLTASYSGFVLGETAANLTTLPTLSTTATASSPPGVYPITVSGATSSNYDITYVAGTLTIEAPAPAASWLSLSTASPTGLLGQEMLFNVAVAPVESSIDVPTGQVVFQEGGQTLGYAMLDATGHASFSISTLGLGPHTITAEYLGDQLFLPSINTASATVTIVSANSTSTVLVGTPSPSVLGQQVAFTATVSGSAQYGIPTGRVAFMEDGTVLYTASLLAGKATFRTTKLTAGTHTITAQYMGSAKYFTSNSTVEQVVDRASTKTAVTTSTTTLVYGKKFTLKAAVTAVAPGKGRPTGTVTFKDGDTVLGSAPLDLYGRASWTVSSLPAGSHTLTAIYNGDANFVEGSGAITKTVAAAATTTLLTASSRIPKFGQLVTLTATVKLSFTSPIVPTGTVTFMDGTVVLGTATLDAAGKAVFSTSSLAVGTHSIRAVYNGTANTLARTSSAVTVRVYPNLTFAAQQALPKTNAASITDVALASLLEEWKRS